MTRRLAAWVMAGALCFGGSGLMADPGDTIEGLSREIQQLLSIYERYGFSGTVLVSKSGEIVFEDGYGLANRETGEQNTPSTRFDFASVAKTFTGAAVLVLEADGLLSTEDRLEAHLGPFPEQKSAATIQHLAAHTAGLAHRSRSELDYSEDRAVWIQSMKDAPFESEPGDSYRYTNAGTSLLAALVEEVADEPFEDFVRARLFGPSGMKASGFYPEFEPGAPGIAQGYVDETDTPAPAEYEAWTWGALGSTGIVSTVGDINRWFLALHDGGLLPPEQTAKAFDSNETEAFGWHTETDDQGRTFVHKGGGLNAMQTQVLAYPDQQIVIVWAHNNMARNWRRALNQGLTAIALGEPYLLPIDPVAAAEGTSDLAGWWRTESGTLLELIATPEGLGAGGNGFGLPEGALRQGADGSWVSFDIERVSSFSLSSTDDGRLRGDLEPEGEQLMLIREDAPRSTAAPLEEPGADDLESARRISGWILNGDAKAVWGASAYRPVRGTNSLADWTQRLQFISDRVGSESNLIEEAWVRREGTWRYWRTFASEGGMEVVLRLGMSVDGQVLAYGINPRSAAPPFEELLVVGE